MKKWIVSIITVVGMFLALYYNKAFVLAKYLQYKLHVPVSIEELHISKEKITIQNIVIKNPKQSRAQIALQIGDISLLAPISTYFKDETTITKSELNNVYISIEFYNHKKTEGNWSTLLDKEDKPKSNKKLTTIKNIQLNNITIDLLLDHEKPKRLSPIEKLEFTNINSNEGIPEEEITDIIAKKVLEEIFILNSLYKLFSLPFKTANLLFLKPIQLIIGSD